MRWRGLGAGFEEQKESLPKKHERRHWQSTTYFSLDCELAISQWVAWIQCRNLIEDDKTNKTCKLIAYRALTCDGNFFFQKHIRKGEYCPHLLGRTYPAFQLRPWYSLRLSLSVPTLSIKKITELTWEHRVPHENTTHRVKPLHCPCIGLLR